MIMATDGSDTVRWFNILPAGPDIAPAALGGLLLFFTDTTLSSHVEITGASLVFSSPAATGTRFRSARQGPTLPPSRPCRSPAPPAPPSGP